MASKAIATQGYQFFIGSAASPPVYTEVKEITGFDGFDGSAAEIDRTHLMSTSKEFLMGLQDFGTYKLDMNYLDSDPGQQAMRVAKGGRTLTKFRAVQSNGAKAEFSGYVGTAPHSGSVDSKVDASMTIRISGDVVFTPSTGS